MNTTNYPNGRRRPQLGEPISVREQEMLMYAATGLTHQQTAEVLGVSPSTVRTHIHHAIIKLGVHDSTSAVLAWLRSDENIDRVIWEFRHQHKLSHETAEKAVRAVVALLLPKDWR